MKPRKPTCLLLAATLCVLLWGCETGDTSTDGDEPTDGDTSDGDSPDGDDSDGDTPPDGDTTEDGDTPEDGDDVEDGDDTEDGDTPPDGDDCDGVILTSASGQVIDGTGAALQNAVALVCLWSPENRAVCLQPSMTNASGRFERDIPPSNACVGHAAVRLLNTADLTWTQLACPYPDIGNGGAVTLPQPARLVSVGEVAQRDPLGEPTSPHRIVSAAGTELHVIPDDLILYDGTYNDLRLLDWDATTHGWPCFIDADDPPAALVALVPELGIGAEGAIQISFANTSDLPAGTTVTLYGMGGAGTYTWDGQIVDEADWVPVGQATVSEDATMIRSDGAGLPFYTWVGYKLP